MSQQKAVTTLSGECEIPFDSPSELKSKVDELQEHYVEHEEGKPREEWYAKSPDAKMQDVKMQTATPVAYIMDHEDRGSKIEYTLWTATNYIIREEFRYPQEMKDDDDLVQFLDLAGLPRTNPTGYGDGTTVPVKYVDDEGSWVIDYDYDPELESMGRGRRILRDMRENIDPFPVVTWSVVAVILWSIPLPIVGTAGSVVVLGLYAGIFGIMATDASGDGWEKYNTGIPALVSLALLLQMVLGFAV